MPSHGLFARYSYGYSNSNPWSREYRLSLDRLDQPKSLFIAEFAFDVLTLAALICGIIWACLIRNHRGVLKGVLTSLFTWLIAMVLDIIEESLFLADVTVTQYYLIDLFLYDFFLLLSECMLIFVFYNVIHKLLGHLTDSGRPYAAAVVIHWIALAFAVALAVASWALYVGYLVAFVQSSSDYHLGTIYNKVESARAIYFWLISLEILAWSIFATVKAGSHRFISRMPAVALIIGSVFWFALNMKWAVIAMRYWLPADGRAPQYLSTAVSVCQFFFCGGIYVGLLTCCMNWSKVGGEDEKRVPTQYAVPASYPMYPAYTTYPQFPQSPQEYPPHMQQLQGQQYYQQPPHRPQQ
ncbi:hypothetical protein N7448_008650 [Penicillium atrosanguineum]|uniref:Uncharacterized protein n=1 Tax=Penicillium atrosanguineum TaxID=1132637 RepID=A0A9W9GRY4_9EURO|nr:hypothetical protein N7448_008650 [Penicillium atrosanguineum]KAJ5148079.1 hypothetical protein N7526_001431 [Penicillium atrosanguineum]KAJ5330627.1 hypothetical protein N7476_000410 [Penicillium atrosanguineum]